MGNNIQTQRSIEKKLKLAFANTNSDKISNLCKGVINLVPHIGPIVGSFYESLIVHPSNRRLQIFLEGLVAELRELQSHTNSVDLSTPVFQTTVLRASQMAVLTHQEEKLKALRNAVLNSSIPNSLDDHLHSIFLNCINDFTPTHILVLKYLDNLEQYKPDDLKAQFPELEKKEGIYNQILKDLVDRGLINLREAYITEEESKNDYFGAPIVLPQVHPQPNKRRGEKNYKTIKRTEGIKNIVDNSAFGINKSKTTELGKQFIQFIESPSSLALS